MSELFGWAGSALLAVCGFPQMVKCIREKRADGLSWGFLYMWAGGEILTLLYVLPKLDIPLIWNYTVNLLFLLPIFWFKTFPKG